jgi:hypothetical protein
VLSFAQERLYFFDQIEPGSAAYNMSVRLDLRGRLDEAVLRRCLAALAGRHESLRTTFAAEDGRPVQVVGDGGEPDLTMADVQGLPHAAEEAERLLVEAEARPFDLSRGPLWRVLVVRRGAEHHVASLTIHHIVSDGWSLGVLVRELLGLYEAFATGGPSPLPPLPVQYGDYALWQRARIDGGLGEAELGYWRERLRDLPVLDLPADAPRPRVQTFRGGNLQVPLAPEMVRGVRELSQRHGVTAFMTLLAAFQTLLARLAGTDDVVVGAPVAGRSQLHTEPLVGVFINTVVMRGDLSGDPPFAELLERTRSMALEAYAHAELPFERLVEALQPERDPSRTPLF